MLLIGFTVILFLWLGLKKNINLTNMEVHETPHFNIYYEDLSPAALQDIAEMLEGKFPQLQDFFSLDAHPKGTIVVYENIEQFQRAYLGWILSLFYGDWASGAAYWDIVLATSPENPGAAHTYTETLDIIVHEYVHTRIYAINETPNIWLDEGLATYLADQGNSAEVTIPSFEILQAEDMGTFLDHDGYAVGQAYVAYLIETYGPEKTLNLIRTNNYEATLGQSAQEVYAEWVQK